MPSRTEYALEETRKHLLIVKGKAGLSREQIELVFDVLLTNLQVVPSEGVHAKWEKAKAIITPIDEADIPFVAAALSITCDGIWSDDSDLKR